MVWVWLSVWVSNDVIRRACYSDEVTLILTDVVRGQTASDNITNQTSVYFFDERPEYKSQSLSCWGMLLWCNHMQTVKGAVEECKCMFWLFIDSNTEPRSPRAGDDPKSTQEWLSKWFVKTICDFCPALWSHWLFLDPLVKRQLYMRFQSFKNNCWFPQLRMFYG